MGTVHIIGAGLSGLAAAMSLLENDHRICLYESSGQAGGRCRSYHDPILDCEIDNGNHLLLGSNSHAWDYIKQLGTKESLICPHNYYPFINIKTEASWCIKPPFTIQGVPLIEYMDLLRLLLAGKQRTVSECVHPLSAIYSRFIAPLCLAVLNTHPDDASAALLGKTLWKTGIHKDGMAPYLPISSWQASLITPATKKLQSQGHGIYYQHALKALDSEGERITGLQFSRTSITVAEGDSVILATPAHITAQLCPDITTPDSFNPIINAHFSYPHEQANSSFIGIMGSTIQWAFFKEGIISTTTSAAQDCVDYSQDGIAHILWHDLCSLMNINAPLPNHRIITEKRATFSATPDNVVKRPSNQTSAKNLFLAGDYTNTKLPASIESAIQSGQTAATLAISYPTL